MDPIRAACSHDLIILLDGTENPTFVYARRSIIRDVFLLYTLNAQLNSLVLPVTIFFTPNALL